MINKLGVTKLEKGFKEFLIKSGIFIVLFVLIQTLIMNIAKDTSLFGEIKLFQTFTLAKAAFFTIILFISLNKKKLLKIKKYEVGLKERVISNILIIFLFVSYFQYKKFLLNNVEIVQQYSYFFGFTVSLMPFIILFFLVSLVFGFKFIKDFFKEHKKGLGLVLIGTIVVYNLIKWFQNLWVYFSGFVAKSTVYLLSFFGTASLSFRNGMPILRFNTFMAGIAKTCSGIDSIFIFTALYLGVLAWDYKILNKKKMLILFIPGVVGAFLLNILRIFLLFLIGSYVSRDFALQAFHTNASAILFLIYFAVFLKLSYGWLKK